MTRTKEIKVNFYKSHCPTEIGGYYFFADADELTKKPLEIMPDVQGYSSIGFRYDKNGNSYDEIFRAYNTLVPCENSKIIPLKVIPLKSPAT